MTRQLRLALSMNGGVSLAVWIGGAVAEIDELRRGAGFWGDLLRDCGYAERAQVDVLAGASAGGLNGVLLAQAIRTGTDFHQFLDLWETKADIDQLVKFGSEVGGSEGERSILRGGYFLRELRDALPPDPESCAVDHDLQLLASATLVQGKTERYRDLQGAPLVDQRSEAYFTVARRGSAARGLDGFAAPDNRQMLARIGRATSSLPGGFEPMRFVAGETGSRLAQAFSPDGSQVEVMDGGVLDNVPIARAIKAIGSVRADGATRRVLVYLHPDPSDEPGVEPPATALEVVRSFVGKRKESLREDIDELRSHNESVMAQQLELEGQLALVLNGSLRGIDTDRLQIESAAALLMRCAAEPDAEIAWHSPQAPRLTSMIDRDDGMPITALRQAVDEALDDAADLLPTHRVSRQVRAVQWLVADAERRTGIDLGPMKAELYELELLCDLTLGLQLGWFVQASSPEDAIASLRASAERISALPDVDGDEDWQTLAAWDLTEAAAAAPSPTGATLRDRLSERLRAAVERLGADADGAPDRLAALDDALATWGPVAAPSVAVLGQLAANPTDEALHEIDLAFAPLSMDRHVSAGPIEFVRIAGNVESPAIAPFDLESVQSNNPKIAGTQLGHLGAFFDRRWRVNDWRMGRLDAVPALVAAILDESAMRTWAASTGRNPATALDELVRERQAQLLDGFRGADAAPNGQVASAVDAADDPNPSFDELLASAWFRAWVQQDRRVASLIGSASLTRTTLRAVFVARRLLVRQSGAVAKAVSVFVLPVVLAVVGTVLAGRRAAVATTWTLCLLAAPRMGTDGARWTTWAVGVGLAAAVSAVTEYKVKPIGRWWHWYALATAGAVAGGSLLVAHEWFAASELPVAGGLDVAWLVASAAAAMSAVMLFFWMPGWLLTTSSAVVAVAYFVGARLDTAADADDAAAWLGFWPLHSLWVYWIAIVIVTPGIVSRVEQRFLARSSPPVSQPPLP